MLIVVSDELLPDEILGEYCSTEEDCISYWTEEDGTIAWCNSDCCRVVKGTRSGTKLALDTL